MTLLLWAVALCLSSDPKMEKREPSQCCQSPWASRIPAVSIGVWVACNRACWEPSPDVSLNPTAPNSTNEVQHQSPVNEIPAGSIGGWELWLLQGRCGAKWPQEPRPVPWTGSPSGPWEPSHRVKLGGCLPNLSENREPRRTLHPASEP